MLAYVAQNGFDKVPVPLKTVQGDSFVRAQDRLWELTPWLPGQANYRREPHEAKLAHAFQALAQFHQAVRSFPNFPSGIGAAPGIVQRLARLHELQRGGCDAISAALDGCEWVELRTANKTLETTAVSGPTSLAKQGLLGPLKARGSRILQCYRERVGSLAPLLHSATTRPVVLQPCIRDIWHDHVLFVGDKVTGLVDFGALQVDSVSADIARLLGSMAGDCPAGRRNAIAAYESVRPLCEDERLLVELYDQSSILLSGLNWLQWLCIERRRFECPERILERLDELLMRLDAARTSGLVLP